LVSGPEWDFPVGSTSPRLFRLAPLSSAEAIGIAVFPAHAKKFVKSCPIFALPGGIRHRQMNQAFSNGKKQMLGL